MKGEYDRMSNRDRLGLTPDLTTRDLWRSMRWAREMGNFVCSSLWDFKSSFICRKILRHGTFPLYFPSERKVCCGFFIALKNPSPWPDFEPATFGSSGQHTNHYTTKATNDITLLCISEGYHLKLHTRRRENLKSHTLLITLFFQQSRLYGNVLPLDGSHNEI
jgi:hypothetical protein